MIEIQEEPRSDIHASKDDGGNYATNLDGRAFWRALLASDRSTQARKRGTPRIQLLRTVPARRRDNATV